MCIQKIASKMQKPLGLKGLKDGSVEAMFLTTISPTTSNVKYFLLGLES